ncbi:DUF11 domain-containing protein [Leucobacter sp. L43]|uniref:DUF7927 domain-containing protein n=1 Tax=Leucobacter sp. L43 TaxID=2798040 RepID=UPI001907F5C7|nr:DUF11 domain-containing protein [Leucobacter sp. L43]
MHTNREHWLRRPGRAAGALLVSAVIAGTSLVASAPTVANAVGESAGGGYASSGRYADTIFWLDMAGFDDAQAKSDAGQDMQVALAGGYTASFNIKDSAESKTDHPYTHRDIVASALPTLGGATGGALGGGTYNDIPGKPALMTAGEGEWGANLLTLRDIEVKDAGGNVVTGYALVGADAEVTDGPQLGGGETITWSSDVPINVIDRGARTNPANPGGCPDPMPGEGTTEVLCDGTWGANGATLATVVSATEPSYLTQRLGETVISRQAVAFGIMTSKVRLTKQVDSRVAPDDSFTVQATSNGNVLSSASTGTGNTATTDEVVVLSNTRVELAETGDGATDLSAYEPTWQCAVNGEPDAALAPADGATSLVVEAGTLPPGSMVDCTVTNTATPPDPELVIEKSANVTELPASGGSVEYTIDVTNNGPGDCTVERPCSFTDDMSGVLDDATYNDDAAASSGTVAVDGSELTWKGALLSGETATVTYSVTAEPNESGDYHLLNTVCLDAFAADPASPCATSSTVGSGAWEDWKESNPASGSVVRPGETIEYVLHFEGTGTAPVELLREDNLSGVLDDAEVVSDPVSNTETLSVSPITDGRFTIEGTLLPGQHAEVTYSVKPKPGAELGDMALANFLGDPGDEGSTCAPVDGERADCTTHGVPGLGIEKSSSFTGVAAPGDRVDYTVTVKNTGGVAFTEAEPAVAHDDLSAVLDDATYNGDAAAETGEVSYAEPTLTWSGPLPVGASTSFTYSVEVTGAGDLSLVNAASIPDEFCIIEDACSATTTTPVALPSDPKKEPTEPGQDAPAKPGTPTGPGAPQAVADKPQGLATTGSEMTPVLGMGLGLAALSLVLFLAQSRLRRLRGDGRH